MHCASLYDENALTSLSHFFRLHLNTLTLLVRLIYAPHELKKKKKNKLGKKVRRRDSNPGRLGLRNLGRGYHAEFTHDCMLATPYYPMYDLVSPESRISCFSFADEA